MLFEERPSRDLILRLGLPFQGQDRPLNPVAASAERETVFQKGKKNAEPADGR